MNTQSRAEIRYQLTDESTGETVQDRLVDLFSIRLADKNDTIRTYYDDFGWRLYHAGILLSVEQVKAGNQLCLHSLSGNSPPLQAIQTDIPVFAADIQTDKIQQTISDCIDIRALVPILSLNCEYIPLDVVDKNDKVVVRLSIERFTSTDSDQPVEIAQYLLVRSVKGYRAEFKKVNKKIESLFGLMPADHHPFDDALATLVIQPSEYSSKFMLRIDPDIRADRAVKDILLTALNDMQLNEQGTIKNIDTEFLHDFRVAVRRTRAAMSQFKHVFPLELIGHYKTEFAWLGEITSPVRDLDVHLQEFEYYQQQLPTEMREDIEPLRTFLKKHLKIERKTLLTGLRSARYRELKKSWRALLESDDEYHCADSSRNIKNYADERIRSMHNKVLKHGSRIQPTSPAEQYHTLRKECKKLRYLLEFFQSLYAEDDIKRLIRQLKNLQDNLGLFQDLDVQSHAIRHYADLMISEGRVPAKTIMAMGVLGERLEHHKLEVRDEFHDRFVHFDNEKNNSRFNNVFNRES